MKENIEKMPPKVIYKTERDNADYGMFHVAQWYGSDVEYRLVVEKDWIYYRSQEYYYDHAFTQKVKDGWGKNEILSWLVGVFEGDYGVRDL